MKKQSAALVLSIVLSAAIPPAPSYAVNCTVISHPMQVIVYDPNPAPDPTQEKIVAF